MDCIEPKWTKRIKQDQSELNRAEVDQSGQNEPSKTILDRIQPKQTEWTEQGQSGQNRPNRTEVDRIGLMQTEWTEVD